MDGLFGTKEIHDLILSVVYSVIGLLFFLAFFFTVVKLAPFPVLKEIEQDQNVALAILMGSVILGLSIIIAAAIH